MYIQTLKHSETVRTISHEIHTLCLLLTQSVSYNALKDTIISLNSINQMIPVLQVKYLSFVCTEF
jgi:hypothetical protein